MRVSGGSDSERVWSQGALGDRKTAERLERHLAGHGVLLLHDCRVPGSRVNIDHITLGAGGVTVIDAEHLHGQVRRRVRGGLLRDGTEHLLVAGRDRTALVVGLLRQVGRRPNGRRGRRRGLRRAAFDVDGVPLLSTVRVNGVPAIGGRAAAKLARRPGALTDEAISALHAKLALALPSA